MPEIKLTMRYPTARAWRVTRDEEPPAFIQEAVDEGAIRDDREENGIMVISTLAGPIQVPLGAYVLKPAKGGFFGMTADSLSEMWVGLHDASD